MQKKIECHLVHWAILNFLVMNYDNNNLSIVQKLSGILAKDNNSWRNYLRKKKSWILAQKTKF